MKVKYFYNLLTGFTPATENADYYDNENGEDWLSIADINSKIVYESKNKISKRYTQLYKPVKAKKGSLLYTFKLSVGKVAFCGKDIYTNEAIASFIPISKEYSDKFMFYSSSLIVNNANTNIYGAPILNQDLIKNAFIPVPPLEEQILIAEYLDKCCEDIEISISNIQVQIENLEEIKNSLITEKVTKGIKTHQSFKKTDIPWAEIIPSSWEIMTNKYIMKKIKEICIKHEKEEIISLSMHGVIVRDLSAGGKMPATFDGYQFVYPGNLLMCLFDYDVTPRCIGYIQNYGITSPAYSQFVMKDGNNAKYYYYYYLMIDNTKELLHLAKNLRHSFTEEELGRINAIVPPLEEQEEIANYLDKKCAEIDAIIADKRAQLETLEEYKKSLIYEYVTGKKEVPNE